VPLATFRELEAGDVLFIDTSHVLKLQGDVEYELIHILPRCARRLGSHPRTFTLPTIIRRLADQAHALCGQRTLRVECLLAE